KTPAAGMSQPFLLRYKVVEYDPPTDNEVGEPNSYEGRLVRDPGYVAKIHYPSTDIKKNRQESDDSGPGERDGWRWEPATNLYEDVHAIKNRWVYVFQRAGDEITWYAEYWLSDTGYYYPVDMEVAKDKERNARPKHAEDGVLWLALPHTKNGKRAYYTFFVSGVRLALKSIRKLETEDYWNLLNPVDLTKDLKELDLTTPRVRVFGEPAVVRKAETLAESM